MDNLVSIIVPIYNAEKYLNKCIESIINQSYKKLEIILVNDGSTDDSKLICENYSKIDSRIILINKTNNGVSNARNIGLDICKGNYIAFVDSDDYIENNMIETMVKNKKMHNTDISICGYNIFSELTGIKKKSDNSKKNIIMDNEETLEEIFTSNKINGFLWNKLFDKKLFTKIRLNEDLDICEDLYTVCNILKENIKIVYIPENLYNYRENLNGATKNVDNLFYNNGKIKYIDVYEQIYELLDKKDKIIKFMKIRSIKTIMETYYLMLKSNYHNKLAIDYIYKSLKKERKMYLCSKLVPIKFKLVFILFTIKLKIDKIFYFIFRD